MERRITNGGCVLECARPYQRQTELFGPKMKKWICLLLFLLFMSSATFAATYPLGKEPQLSAYSEHWNDISGFRDIVAELGYKTSTIAGSPLVLGKLNMTADKLLVVAGVEKEFDGAEVDAIYNFVRTGGGAIIADDFGYGSCFAKKFGIDFDGGKLRDINYDKNPKFVKCNATFGNAKYELLLNDATALVPDYYDYYTTYADAYWTVLSTTTRNAWIDENCNDMRDNSEISTPMPLIVAVRTGFGIAVFIADPSIMINDMIYRAENAQFIRALLGYIFQSIPSNPNEGMEVIFDESRHTSHSAGESAASGTLGAIVLCSSSPIIAAFFAACIFIPAIWAMYRRKSSKPFSHRDTLDEVKANAYLYPSLNWTDTQRLRYIMLEKIRLRRNLSEEQMKALSASEISQYVGDRLLEAFLTSTGNVHDAYLPPIMRAVQAWGENEKIA